MAVTRTYTFRAPIQGLNVALWVAQWGLGVIFAMVGFAKLTLTPIELMAAIPWTADVPLGLVRFIGLAEFAGALGLVLPAGLKIAPRLTPIAALGLTSVMVLAVLFHFSRNEVSAVLLPLTLGGLAAFIAWGRAYKVPITSRVPHEREADSPRRN